MEFALEFFAVAQGERSLLDRKVINLPSIERAEGFATSVARNVSMNDELADVCAICDKAGRVLKEIRFAHREPPVERRSVEAVEVSSKDHSAAKALGKRGGEARAKKMLPERRAEIAKKAAAHRWLNTKAIAASSRKKGEDAP